MSVALFLLASLLNVASRCEATALWDNDVVLEFEDRDANEKKGNKPTEEGCGDGWVELASDCSDAKPEDKLCAKIGKPLQFVSWLHLQYVCDEAGGHLPEPTDGNNNLITTLLTSYGQIFGTQTLMYLGATDVTHSNNWKWSSSKKDLKGALEPAKWSDNNVPSTKANKDCLALDSETSKWMAVDCENDNLKTLIANLCVKQASKTNQAVKELPAGA